MTEQLALLPEYLTAHLQLTLLALGIGFAVSLPAGVWASRRPRMERVVLGAAGAAQTIPSLALLAVMVPALALLAGWLEPALGRRLSSIGFLPALIALSIYSLLPILRNTVTGLAGVDRALIEAARAVGMTPRDRLLKVELPLAAPVIVAGVRTATVWVVGTATLSTPVGATSLGNYIFSGLQTRNYDAVLVGCAAAAALALALDALIRLLEVGVARRRRPALVASATLLAALYLYAGATLTLGSVAGERRDAVRVGAKTFTEQYILSELVCRRIESAGRPCRAVSSLGSTVAFDALRAGEIDLYVEYTGTIWATLMDRRTAGLSRRELTAEVEEFLNDRHGVRLLAPLGFENAYALAMRTARAEELGVRSLSDLARVSAQLEIGGDYEFFERSEWRDLERVYGFAFGARRSMDPSLMYQAVTGGDVDVISAFSTDGRIAAYDLRVLEDDRDVIPPYDAVVLARAGFVEQAPAAAAAVRGLAGRIDAAAMRELNLAVDRDGESPAAVARRFDETLR